MNEVGVPVEFLLGIVAFSILLIAWPEETSLPPTDMEGGLPGGVVLVAVGMITRLQIRESPALNKVKQASQNVAQVPACRVPRPVVER
ncbi:MAG TPA: hypothetical protein VHM69_14955 [Rubrobacter sp.]|nr:hypothetical protein [Rubrobacter sp.]